MKLLKNVIGFIIVAAIAFAVVALLIYAGGWRFV